MDLAPHGGHLTEGSSLSPSEANFRDRLDGRGEGAGRSLQQWASQGARGAVSVQHEVRILRTASVGISLAVHAFRPSEVTAGLFLSGSASGPRLTRVMSDDVWL